MADLKNANKILRILNRRYRVKPHRGRPFRVLIGCLLSHRTKDETTWPSTNRLFSVANTPQKMLKLSEKKIARVIYPVGFYNQKAKRIKQICRILLKRFNGKVPKTREELMKLPGVGGKTADIVLSYAYGKAVIAVDTHVAKIAQRLGWSKQKEPEKIRADLHKLIPPSKRIIVNHLLVSFGKDVCQSRKPLCYKCSIEELCPYPNKTPKPKRTIKPEEGTTA